MFLLWVSLRPAIKNPPTIGRGRLAPDATLGNEAIQFHLPDQDAVGFLVSGAMMAMAGRFIFKLLSDLAGKSTWNHEH